MPSFKDLKVGDPVFVVTKVSHLTSADVRTQCHTVVKVGRKYGWIKSPDNWNRFRLDDGCGQCATRPWRIFRSEHDWKQSILAEQQRARLNERLTHIGYSLKPLPPEAVADLHAVLDKHGL